MCAVCFVVKGDGEEREKRGKEGTSPLLITTLSEARGNVRKGGEGERALCVEPPAASSKIK